MVLLKKTALHLHNGTIQNAKDNSASLANLSELFIAISVIIAIIIFMFYKYTISNNALNSDTAKSAAPVS